MSIRLEGIYFVRIIVVRLMCKNQQKVSTNLDPNKYIADEIITLLLFRQQN